MLNPRAILVVAGLCACQNLLASISIGFLGSTNWAFDSPPAAADWSTLSVGSGSTTITSVSQLDAAVQSLSASAITNALPLTATYPPAENSLARWNSTKQWLQTRPADNAYTVLMATLRNDSGQVQSYLTVNYDLSIVSTGLAGTEPVPGVRVFYSLTGTPNSWQWLPELSGTASGTFVASIFLGSWPANSLLYLLWADDNSTTETDAACAIDNFMVRTFIDDNASLELVSPVNGTSFSQGTTISMTAFARFFGTMTNCIFYSDGQAVSVDSTPHTGDAANGNYAGASPGAHQLKAIARNSAGQSLTSSVVQITVQSVAGPAMAIDLANETVARITWPLSSTGFVLQATADLGAPAWTDVDEPDNQFGGLHHVYVSILDGPSFFRLIQP